MSKEKKPREQKIKSRLAPEQLRSILSQWLLALDQKQPFDFSIEGRECHVPASALAQGEAKIEYELEGKDCELELKLKWKAETQEKAA